MKNKIDFVKGNTPKCLFAMVMPLLMAMILTMAYNLVDSLWVGNLLGEAGYAALTNSTAIVLILSAIAMGASNGAAIIISQAVGAGKKEEAEGIITTMLVMAAVFSFGVTVVLELSLKFILIWMRTPAELFDMAYAYLSIYLIGYIAIFLYMHFTAVFRSFGDALFQMKGMLLSTIFNAVLDPIMIHGMGLTGAAWATVLSEVICLVFALFYYSNKKMFKLQIHSIHITHVKALLANAVPAAIQSCMPAISSAVMLFLVTGFGITTIAAYGVTSKLEILLFYPAMAMNMGLTTIVGQCVGAKRLDRVKDYMKCALAGGSIFIAVISALVIAFAKGLTGFFIDSAETAVIVQGFFNIVSIGYVLYMITSCYLGELSGMGKPGISMLLMFIYYIVVRVPLASLLEHTEFGLNGIWAAILVSHILAAVLAAFEGIRIEKKMQNAEQISLQHKVAA
ncbi:MAG: MATE family efflux transporter [Lachnospiraceae bacterium]|nr:MATE family efflux transporter [Lachnospiraceae bacterium]